MAKLGFLRRLIKEDFKKDQQDLVGKIASILNPFMDSITNALTNQLTFEDNLNAQVTTITVSVDGNGIPTSPLSVKYNLTSTATKLWVVSSQNTTNSNSYLTGAPFLEWSNNGTQININHITGLTAGNSYQLTLVIMV